MDYWPYAKAQETGTSKLVDRFITWQQILIDFTKYFKDLVENQRQNRSNQTKFIRCIDKHGILMGNDYNDSVLKPWRDLAVRSDGALAESSKLAESFILDRISNASYTLAKKLKESKAKITKMSKNVQTNREKCVKAILKAQKANMAETFKSDPFIAAKELERDIECMVFAENQFQNSMNGIFKDLHELEIYLISEIESIMSQFTLINNSHLHGMQNQISKTVYSYSRESSLMCFEKFKEDNSLDSVSVWKQERRISDFSIPIKKINIIKSGSLFIKDKKAWKPAKCFLNDAGYFSCFLESKESLQDHHILERENTLNDNESECSDKSTKISSKSIAEPILSVMLRKPGTVIEQNEDQFVLRFISKGGFFSGKDKMFSIKGESYESTQEWAILLRDYVSANIEGPPVVTFDAK